MSNQNFDPRFDAERLRGYARLLSYNDDTAKLKHDLNEIAMRLETGAYQPKGEWSPVPPRSCINPTHEAADAFWSHWRMCGEQMRHGYYESTWGAINAALAASGTKA